MEKWGQEWTRMDERNGKGFFAARCMDWGCTTCEKDQGRKLVGRCWAGFYHCFHMFLDIEWIIYLESGLSVRLLFGTFCVRERWRDDCV